MAANAGASTAADVVWQVNDNQFFNQLLYLKPFEEEPAEPQCVCGDFNPPAPDGAVNLLDFAQFSLCFGGSPATPGCECTDMNQDGAINLFDFATFGLIFGGPSSGSPPGC